ncbi:aminotransferase class I/II-fold pyridoxal phosphate-dependent enzyme [Enterobacter hormaechei]|uniref:aminotransferase class I/II-fold pyridoxal phosphate-dependent enzyme n=1 Tax=Enterobacter hormaechei TaxID=158836 RepID=UPI001F45A75F|nr:aminotransferase class I/II-fold pyridoxal phosphate-dependent enzyme [Enterobacter hormaechei]
MMFSKKIRECVEGANNNASIRLHANENPLGSPDIIQTGQYDLSLLSLYPDPTYNALRAAIGERWNINPEQIITGNGSDERIDITLRSLLKPGARLTAPRHSFMMYKKRTDILGALYSEIPVKSGRILPEDLKEAVSHKPDILVLVNPSNPLGHYIAPSEMISLVETIPPETTIIIDEAYAEFTPDIENTAGIQIVHKRVNSICLRTFSKAYGLAGLRLGWAYVSTDLYPALPIARIELLNVSAVRACNAYSKLGLSEKPHLFVELHVNSLSMPGNIALFEEHVHRYGGEVQLSSHPEEREALWVARHDAWWAFHAFYEGCQGIPTDICVPLSCLSACISATETDIANTGLKAPLIGHVGDGNFHLLLMLREGEEETPVIQGFLSRLAERALSYGGTISGEHGVGQGKIKWMPVQHGAALHLMKAIK